MEQQDFRLDMDRKDAKKLREAIAKGTFYKLTPAQASALEDLVIELEMQVGGK